MAYIGQRPVIGRYIKLDQISSGFNGSNTGFSMTAGSQAVFPGTARNLLLSLGGVIQEPDTDFTISGSTLTFTTPPVANTTFFGVIYGDMQATGTPSDGTVLPASIASSGNFSFPEVTVTGDVTISNELPTIALTDTGTNPDYELRNENGEFRVRDTTSGVNRMRITSGGTVDVAGNLDVGAGLDVTGNITATGDLTVTGGDVIIQGTEAKLHLTDTNNDDDYLVFNNNGTFKVYDVTNNADRLQINSSGVVTIGGNTDFGAGIDVTGAITATGNLTVGSTDDKLEYGSNPRLYLKVPDGTNGLRIDASTTPLEIRNSDANGRSLSFGSGGASNFNAVLSGDYSLSSSGFDSSPTIFFNTTRHNGTTTVTSFQCSVQAVATSNASNTGYLGFGSSATPDDLVIKTDGKVGIGTTSPGYKLDVKNNSTTAYSSSASPSNVIARLANGSTQTNSHSSFLLTSTNDNGAVDFWWMTIVSQSTNYDGFLAFSARTTSSGSQELVRFANNGRVSMQVLALGSGNSHASAKLVIQGTGNTSGTNSVYIKNSDETPLLVLRNDGVFYTGTDEASPYNLTTSSNANVVVTSDGVLRRSTSSVRYKKDIADATFGLADVLKLKPKTFKNNATGEFADDKTYAGFTAEDIHDLGLTEFVQYNEDNEPDALAYGNMVALMAKAIQELNAKVAALEAA